jgi:hypothetical protein
MEIEFDPAKRDATLEARGLDMARETEILSGPALTVEDDRQDYGEMRSITVGLLDDRMVVVVWTQHGERRRIISLRKANDREQDAYRHRL